MAVIDELVLKADIQRLFPDGNYHTRKQPNLREYLDILVDNLVALETAVINNFVSAAYGGIDQSTPVGIADLGIGYVTMPADAAAVSAPRGITQDFANNGIRFDIEGIFTVGITLAIAHNEVNAGRAFRVRLYNVDTATGGSGTLVGTGRNTSVTNFGTSILAEVPLAVVGDLFVVQVGGGDAYTTVEVESYSFDASHVSEFKGNLQ
jgi:hypothetical protein